MSDPYEGVREPAPEVAGLSRSIFEPSPIEEVAEAIFVASERESEVYVERFDDCYRWSLVHKGGAYPLLPRHRGFLADGLPHAGHRLPHRGRRVHRARRVPRGRAGARRRRRARAAVGHAAGRRAWRASGRRSGDAAPPGASSPPACPATVRRRGCGAQAGAASPRARAEHRLHLRQHVRRARGEVLPLLGVPAQVVQLVEGLGGRRREGVRRQAVLGVPLIEPLVVVVELPELARPAVGGRQGRDDRLDVGRARGGLVRLAGEEVALRSNPARRRLRS